MPEFTGERVIPELVDPDLLNEHLARYRFAARFVKPGAQVLDAGCGSGYGSAELAKTGASVTGADISAEAVAMARERYAGIRFVEAPCEALPLDAASFDLVTAFEVIEHLERWQELLREAGRVLKADGVLLVSTPNRDYYAESRGTAGPNPFHVHEFDYPEFRDALGAVFPHVRIWTQNHAEAIVFAPQEPTGALLEAAGGSDPASAHFYLAACSRSPIAVNETFAWAPSSANVLREREHHIAKLSGELEQKDAWLRQNIEAHSELQRKHEEVTAELIRANNWAEELNRELAARNARIVDLQQEVETRLMWIADLESQIESASAEIERMRMESAARQREAREVIDRLENTVSERTAWAERLNAEIADYRGELQRIGSSQWFRAGAKLGVGPRLRDGQ